MIRYEPAWQKDWPRIVNYRKLSRMKSNDKRRRRSIVKSFKALPSPVGKCPTCLAEPLLLVAPPTYSTSNWFTIGLPLVAYLGEGTKTDPSIGLDKAHILVPMPFLSEQYMERFRMGGSGFMCYSCLGYGRPGGYHSTVTGVTPAQWLTWVLKHGMSALPVGFGKMDKEQPPGKVDLSSLMVDFYLSSYVYHKASEIKDESLAGEALDHLKWVTEFGASKVVDYLYAACLGESRHVVRLLWSPTMVDRTTNVHYRHLALGRRDGGSCSMCRWWLKNTHALRYKEYKKTGDGCAHWRQLPREEIYHKNPKPHTKVECLKYLHEMFSIDPLWEAGYGGPLWATGAGIGAAYQPGNQGTNAGVLDRIFNVTHNGGTIFNKSSGHVNLQAAHVMSQVLETKARAKHFGEYAWMAGFASSPLSLLYKRLAYNLLEKGEPVLWDAEKRHGREK